MTSTKVKAVDEKFCSSCGENIKLAAEICPRCGVRQNYGPASRSYPQTADGTPYVYGRNKWVAFLLAFFLGGIGIHKFYLGKTAQGVLYLLFFWTLIPSLIAFVEMIIYLFTPEDKFRERYPY